MTLQRDPHFNKQHYYYGLTITNEFNDLQSNIDVAIKRQQRFLTGYSTIQSPSVTADSPPSQYVKVGAGSVVLYDGTWCSWSDTLTVDSATATKGSLQGSTTVTVNLNVRWVILGIGFKLEESDTRTTDDSQVVNFRQDAGYQCFTYMTAEQASGTDWRSSAVVASLLSSMRINDNVEPIAIAEIAYGSSVVQTTKVWKLQRNLWESGTPFDENRFIRSAMAYTMGRPIIENSSGTVSIVTNTQPGAPGQIVIAGGEKILIGFKDPQDGNKIRMVEKTVPSATINFPAQNTKYIVRLKTDSDGNSIIYYGTGDYPLNSPLNQDGQGTQDGTSQGFPATLLDMPLAEVTTGNNGTLPTTMIIPNTSLSFDRQIFPGDVYVSGDVIANGKSFVGQHLKLGDDTINADEGTILFQRNDTHGPRITVNSPSTLGSYNPTASSPYNSTPVARMSFMTGSTPTTKWTEFSVGQLLLTGGGGGFQPAIRIDDTTGDTTRQMLLMSSTMSSHFKAQILTNSTNFDYSGTPTGSKYAGMQSNFLRINGYFGGKVTGTPGAFLGQTRTLFIDHVAMAFGRFVAANPPTIVGNAQFNIDVANCVKVATGVYDIQLLSATYSGAIPDMIDVCPMYTAETTWVYDTSNSTSNKVRIKFYNGAGAAVDVNFSVKIYEWQWPAIDTYV